MSKQAFKAFMEKLSSDASLRGTLEKAGPDGMSAAALATAGAAHGFKFTAEDVTDELSDSQLDGVAGGAVSNRFRSVDGESTKSAHDKWG